MRSVMLDELAELSDRYISDLRNGIDNNIYQILCIMQLQKKYSLTDWVYTIRYITGDNEIEFKSITEIILYARNNLVK